jgi:hypothetical protein
MPLFIQLKNDRSAKLSVGLSNDWDYGYNRVLHGFVVTILTLGTPRVLTLNCMDVVNGKIARINIYSCNHRPITRSIEFLRHSAGQNNAL